VRPFVTRRLPLRETIVAGCVLGALGLAELAWFVNGLTAILSAITLGRLRLSPTRRSSASRKSTRSSARSPARCRRSSARPPRPAKFNVEGWTLFAVLACWQLPHFYAIAWMYRTITARPGLRMVSTDDATGRRTAIHAVVSAAILLPVSWLPYLTGNSGWLYAMVATVCGLAFLAAAIRFARQADRPHARKLFFMSIIYLPVILIALAVDVSLGNW
jgi:protoheme IX farnesyltransferase